jgi:hypothetical protein
MTWLIFVLALVVLVVTFGLYTRHAAAEVERAEFALAAAREDAEAARGEAAKALGLVEEARVEASNVRRRLEAYDRFIVGVVGERDAWAGKCETLQRKNAAAQDMLWRHIENLSRLIARTPPADLKSAAERLKAEQAALAADRPHGPPARPAEMGASSA